MNFVDNFVKLHDESAVSGNVHSGAGDCRTQVSDVSTSIIKTLHLIQSVSVIWTSFGYSGSVIGLIYFFATAPVTSNMMDACFKSGQK